MKKLLIIMLCLAGLCSSGTAQSTAQDADTDDPRNESYYIFMSGDITTDSLLEYCDSEELIQFLQDIECHITPPGKLGTCFFSAVSVSRTFYGYDYMTDIYNFPNGRFIYDDSESVRTFDLTALGRIKSYVLPDFFTSSFACHGSQYLDPRYIIIRWRRGSGSGPLDCYYYYDGELHKVR